MFSLHNHTGISSASRGFTDSSIKLEDLVKTAKKIGLQGIAITDHESVGSYVQAKELEKKYNFPIICGNEIYLVSEQQDYLLRNEYKKGMYYPHFLLLALDEIGNRQLRDLSSIAWTNSYIQSGLVRTSTLMSDVEKIISNNKGHVVASTACLGSQLDRWILDIIENSGDRKRIETRKRQINDFLQWCVDTFGKDNFYLECQPPAKTNDEKINEQVLVNHYLKQLSNSKKIPLIITTDSHYLKKELLPIHAAFLNSKDGGGEREVEEFYATAYLMNEKEVIDYFKEYWTMEEIKKALYNTCKIGNRAKRYDFNRKQVIPKIKLEENWEVEKEFFPKHYEYINKMVNSSYKQDRYLMFLIQKGMKKLIDFNDYKNTFERIEQEVTEFWHVSEIIEDRLSAYFVTISKLVEIMWEEGDSLVGVGRGSAVSSIISYLLEVTQINPIKMPVEMPFYRFIDRERAEMPDIDVDTQSNRRKQVFLAVQKYFEKLGGEVVNCCTYGTLGSKSAIQTACRGLGIPQEDGMTISSLIPTERGFTWSLNDCYYGNDKKHRKPIKEFINLINQYDQLWEVASLIEGVIVSRGVHASGVFITNDKFENYGAKMKSPDGTIISQWDLHDSEKFGSIKYDFLTISALTKIRLTMDMLVENGYIQKKSTLKKTYYSILDPHKINYNKQEIWNLVKNNEVMDLFQFDSLVAMQTVSQIQPQSLVELAQSNSLMRLQPQEGATETPTETYTRYRRDIQEWYRDMDKAKVPKKDQGILEKVLLNFNGVADTQEAIMALSRTKELTGFSVGEAHKLRSIIGKKKMDKIPALKKVFYERGLKNNVCEKTLDYIWNNQFLLQLGYSFSILHCIAYTFIALQELILYNDYPSIYWNTATLTVNSGSVNDERQENETSRNKTTNYGKIAKAIGELQQNGITVSLPLINQADYSFTPDEKNNRIIFGLRGIQGIGDDVAKTIINLRPYTSLKDFYHKVTNIDEKDTNNVKIGNAKIITLIKAGAFDELENKDRINIMNDFIKMTVKPRVTLDMRSIKTILEFKIIPNTFEQQVRFINFKNYILNKSNFVKKDKKYKSKNIYALKGEDDYLTSISEDFFIEHFTGVMIEDKHYWYNDQGKIEFYDNDLKNVVNQKIKKLRFWLKTDVALNKYNKKLYQQQWNKYCKGNISKWEMDSVSFYAHEHELSKVNKDKYNIVDFNQLPEEPKIIGNYEWKGRMWDEYEIYRIIGTVLDRNKTKHTVSLLTTTGVIILKMYSGRFSYYDKQIAKMIIEKDEKKKQIIEPSWFTRGNLLSIVGFRKGNMFIPKKYRNSIYRYTIQKITDVKNNGDIKLQSERKKVGD